VLLSAAGGRGQPVEPGGRVLVAGRVLKAGVVDTLLSTYNTMHG